MFFLRFCGTLRTMHTAETTLPYVNEISLPFILLQLDKEAMEKAPRVLEGTPYYKAEQLLLSGESWSGNVRFVGYGEEGIGLRFYSSLFMKIFRYAPIPREVFSAFIFKVMEKRGNLIGWNEELMNPNTFNEFARDLTGEVSNHFESMIQETLNFSKVENQAVGFVIGHRILPNRIPRLFGVLTYDNKPVGFITEFIEGEVFNPSDSEVSLLEEDLGLLESHGVEVDLGRHASKNFVRDPYGNIKFIDVDYAYGLEN